MGGGGGKEGDKLPVPQRAFSAAARRPGPASDPTRWVSPFLTRLQEGIFASGFFLGVPRRNLPSAGYRPSIGRTAKKTTRLESNSRRGTRKPPNSNTRANAVPNNVVAERRRAGRRRRTTRCKPFTLSGCRKLECGGTVGGWQLFGFSRQMGRREE